MDWIRKNKFLAGFLGVVIVAAGVLGYLTITEMGAYDKTSEGYDAAVKELDRLQTSTPFPYQPSKGKLVQLRQDTAKAVADLQKRLADLEPAPEREKFSPTEFQDKLRRVVDETVQAAHAANVELPAEFYMGFEQYRGVLPEALAAPALSRQLDAIQDMLKILIARRIDKLTLIKRAPLPQEPGGNAAAPAGAPGTRPKPGATSAPAESISRQVVEVAFTCQPSVFREALDDLVTAKRLFLVRGLQVKNEMQKGPPRDAGGVAAQATPPPTGAPDAGATAPPTDKPAITYIVGLEKLAVDLRVEIVKVAPPAAVAAR